MCLFHIRGLKQAMSLNSPTRMQQLRCWGQMGLPGNRRPRFSEPCLWENPLSEATGSFWSHSVHPTLVVSPVVRLHGRCCGVGNRLAHRAVSPVAAIAGRLCAHPLPHYPPGWEQNPHHAFPSGSADIPTRNKVVLTYCVTISPLGS